MSKLGLNQAETKLKVGISQCLLGDKVRYNGEHKCLSFAVNSLKPYADFYAICPEMSIGLPSPRPALGLYQCKDKSIIMRFNDTQLSQQPINDRMQQFCQQTLPNLSHLSGYIVCAKSPSCGLMNARVYNIDNNDFIKTADGIFTANIRTCYPWVPIEDNVHLEDSSIQIHFMIRLLALQRLNKIKDEGLTRHALIAFHSRYKSLLLAHSQPKYRELGPFVANIEQWEYLDDFFYQYRQKFMDLLAIPASRENHTNVLMHLQGYFNRFLGPQQKQNLTNIILAYRKHELSLDEPIAYLKNYLSQFPNDYLSQQYYFDDYPCPFSL